MIAWAQTCVWDAGTHARVSACVRMRGFARTHAAPPRAFCRRGNPRCAHQVWQLRDVPSGGSGGSGGGEDRAVDAGAPVRPRRSWLAAPRMDDRVTCLAVVAGGGRLDALVLAGCASGAVTAFTLAGHPLHQLSSLTAWTGSPCATPMDAAADGGGGRPEACALAPLGPFGVTGLNAPVAVRDVAGDAATPWLHVGAGAWTRRMAAGGGGVGGSDCGVAQSHCLAAPLPGRPSPPAVRCVHNGAVRCVPHRNPSAAEFALFPTVSSALPDTPARSRVQLPEDATTLSPVAVPSSLSVFLVQVSGVCGSMLVCWRGCGNAAVPVCTHTFAPSWTHLCACVRPPPPSPLTEDDSTTVSLLPASRRRLATSTYSSELPRVGEVWYRTAHGGSSGDICVTHVLTVTRMDPQQDVLMGVSGVVPGAPPGPTSPLRSKAGLSPVR
jgi:hypothetical protein